MEKLFTTVKHCKRCGSTDLVLIAKGNNYMGDFGDLYECQNCGLVNDSFRIEKVEYGSSEYQKVIDEKIAKAKKILEEAISLEERRNQILLEVENDRSDKKRDT